MNKILKELIIAFIMRTWIITARVFVMAALIYSYFTIGSIWLLIAAVISLPLVVLAIQRFVETIALCIRILPNLRHVAEQVELGLQKEKNKQYLKKL